MRFFRLLLLCVALTWACSDETEDPAGVQAPSDDPADWVVDTSVEYKVTASPVRWVVPSKALPPETKPGVANNNVDIVLHGDRLYMAWRTGPTHFASTHIRMLVVSSTDRGQTWDFELEISIGADVREPRFLSFRGRLLLIYFEAGVNPVEFQPLKMWRTERLGQGKWSTPEVWGNPRVVPWCLRSRGETVYFTSYAGTHYGSGQGDLGVYFTASDDGLNFKPVSGAGKGVVYHGGVSEVAFELDEAGDLWAVTRNEDGDDTGFGSHLCTAKAGALGSWTCPKTSDPNRYDSPWMFRHGDDLYLAARRDVGGPYDMGKTGLTFKEKKADYLKAYSLRPKRFALYRIDRKNMKVVHLMDLPGVGDTAFPSVRRTGAHTFLLANYTAPLDRPDITWLEAQMSPKGTQIYLLELTFSPK